MQSSPPDNQTHPLERFRKLYETNPEEFKRLVERYNIARGVNTVVHKRMTDIMNSLHPDKEYYDFTDVLIGLKRGLSQRGENIRIGEFQLASNGQFYTSLRERANISDKDTSVLKSSPDGVIRCGSTIYLKMGGDFVFIKNIRENEIGITVEQLRVAHRTLFEKKEAINKVYIDKLTGIGNRNAYQRFREKLDKDGTSHYAVIAFDLSNFKLVNDSYGHKIGDAILVEAARLLKQKFRRHGLEGVFRLGGDEFVAIVPLKTDGDRTKQEEEIRADFSETLFHKENGLIPKFNRHQLREVLGSKPITDDSPAYEQLRFSWGLAVKKEGESLEETRNRADLECLEKTPEDGKANRARTIIEGLKSEKNNLMLLDAIIANLDQAIPKAKLANKLGLYLAKLRAEGYRNGPNGTSGMGRVQYRLAALLDKSFGKNPPNKSAS